MKRKVIEITEKVVIYENPIPNLVSRHAYFPGLAKMPSGDIIALFTVAEAFESINSAISIARSKDGGRTWKMEGQIFKNPVFNRMGPSSFKPTVLKDGTVIVIGYGFRRDNPEVLVNPETGGLPEGLNLISFSMDEGRTWSEPEKIPLSRPETLETSGACIQLANGEIIATGATFPVWDGTRPSGRVGVLLRSKDNGRSWDDRTLFYRSSDGNVIAYETRSCQMQDGRIVVILWLLDEVKGKNLTNHIVVSQDNGYTWSTPLDTGIPGQASNLLPLQDNFLLSVHCYREGDTGLYVNIVDFSDDRWKVITTEKIWGNTGAKKIGGLKDMGKNLKFGQPSILPVGEEEFLVVHWTVEDCLGKIFAHRIRIDLAKAFKRVS
ncbi:MAG TPA: sialidase family protein [bacterium]|nr:sialidase family protein [bacterium]HPP29790.1 sialidase family protein [bacterium]